MWRATFLAERFNESLLGPGAKMKEVGQNAKKRRGEWKGRHFVDLYVCMCSLPTRILGVSLEMRLIQYCVRVGM